MRATPAPIDGYDWDTSDDSGPAYPARDRDDACKRACEWRRSQSPHTRLEDWTWEGVAPVPADDPEWLHIGDVITWDKSRLRIVWHPTTDAVRVERPNPRHQTIDLPTPPPVPPRPITYSATIKPDRGDPGIFIRLRPLSAPGRDDLTLPTMSLHLPPPPDADLKAWELTAWSATHGYNEVAFPATFLETPAAERTPIIRAAVYDLMERIARRPDRRR